MLKQGPAYPIEHISAHNITLEVAVLSEMCINLIPVANTIGAKEGHGTIAHPLTLRDITVKETISSRIVTSSAGTKPSTAEVGGHVQEVQA